MRKLKSCDAFLAAVYVCSATNAQDVVVDESANKAASSGGIDFFEKEIVPILKRHCYECHSHESGKAQGGLVLDSRHGWKKGGSEGAAIVPGQPGESLLIEAIRYESYETKRLKKLANIIQGQAECQKILQRQRQEEQDNMEVLQRI